MIINHFKIRIPGLSSVPKIALAFGVILTGSSIFAGGAQASGAGGSFSCNFLGGSSGTPPPSPVPVCNSTPITLGDKVLTILDTSGLGAPGHIEFDWYTPVADQNWLDDNWSTNVIFDTPAVAGTAGQWEYTLAVDPTLGAGYQFKSVKLDGTSPGITQVDKFINDFNAAYLTSLDGAPDKKSLNGKFITVRDSYNVTSGTLVSFANTYDQQKVPGPLPLLGAGAAFGFSRRLRSRIKRARLA